MSEAYRQERLDIRAARNSTGVEVLEGRDPRLAAWIERTRKSGHLYRLIDLMKAHSLATNQKVISDADVIDVFEKALSMSGNRFAVRSSDFGTKNVLLNGTSRVLRDNGVERRRRGADLVESVSGTFGAISHRGIVDVFNRDVSRRSWYDVRRTRRHEVLFDQQPHSLFRPLSREEFDPDLCAYTPNLVGEIDFLWNLNAGRLKEDPGSIDSLEFKRDFSELEAVVAPVFGRHFADAQDLAARTEHQVKYVETVLTWAGALPAIASLEPKILFPEVEVSRWRDTGFGGGRIDALEVVSVDGYAPNVEDVAYLRGVQEEFFDRKREERPSAGDLAARFSRELEVPVGIAIHDFKFGVGDALRRGDVIEADDVGSSPIARHRQQVEDYMARASISLEHSRLEGRGSLNVREMLGARDPFQIASVWYFLPYDGVFVHDCSLDPTQKEEIFDGYRARYEHARARADLRTTDLIVAEAISRSLRGEDIDEESMRQGDLGREIAFEIDAFLQQEPIPF